jgi:DNA polymerase III subunit delta
MFSVYLLLGPESGEKSQYVKNIREELKSLHGESPELYRFYPFETENGEILQVLRNRSLFSPHQLVLLSQIETMNAASTAMIAEYLKKPSPDSTLILISSDNRVPGKLEGLVPKEAVVRFWEMNEQRKQEWLIRYFRSQGLDITDEAVELILELVENNTSDLRSTCSQLAGYLLCGRSARGEDSRESPEITEAEVEQFVYHSRKENVFSLFSALTEGSLKHSLEIYRTLLFAGEAEPVPLFAGLLWQFRRLFSFISLLEDGTPESAAFAGTTVMGKAAKILGRKNQEIYRRGASVYSLRETALIISAIGNYDAAVRELGAAMQQVLVEKFLYDVTVHKGRTTGTALGSSAAAHQPASFRHHSLSLI